MAAEALLGFGGSSPTPGMGRWPFLRKHKGGEAEEPARAARNGGAGRERRGREREEKRDAEEEEEKQEQQPPRAIRKELARAEGHRRGLLRGRERSGRASALSSLCLRLHLPRISRAAEGSRRGEGGGSKRRRKERNPR